MSWFGNRKRVVSLTAQVGSLTTRLESSDHDFALERAAHLNTVRRFTQAITGAAAAHQADARHISKDIPSMESEPAKAAATARAAHHTAVAHSLLDVARDMGIDR